MEKRDKNYVVAGILWLSDVQQNQLSVSLYSSSEMKSRYQTSVPKAWKRNFQSVAVLAWSDRMWYNRKVRGEVKAVLVQTLPYNWPKQLEIKEGESNESTDEVESFFCRGYLYRSNKDAQKRVHETAALNTTRYSLFTKKQFEGEKLPPTKSAFDIISSVHFSKFNMEFSNWCIDKSSSWPTWIWLGIWGRKFGCQND